MPVRRKAIAPTRQRQVFPPTTEWTTTRSDRADGEGLQIPAQGQTSFLKKSIRVSRRSLRQVGADHPDAWKAVHAHVSSICPKAPTKMVSASAWVERRSMDLIGTAPATTRTFSGWSTKVLKRIDLPLRRPYRPYGEEQFDRCASASSSIQKATSRSTSSRRIASARESATTGCSIASASRTCCSAPA